MKNLFLCCLLLVGASKLHAQTTIVANADMDVVYQGILNPLTVKSDKVSKKKLRLVSSWGTIYDSSGRFFLYLPKVKGYDQTKREVTIRLYNQSKSLSKAVDSVTLRVKKITSPVFQVGSLSANGLYSIGELAIQNTFYVYIDGFAMRNVKYVVTSLRMRFFDLNQNEVSSKIIVGNSTHFLREQLQDIKGNYRIEFDQIKAVLKSAFKVEEDTIDVDPAIYYIKFDSQCHSFGDYYRMTNWSNFKAPGNDSIERNKRINDSRMVVGDTNFPTNKERFYTKVSYPRGVNGGRTQTEYFKVTGKDTLWIYYRIDSADVLMDYIGLTKDTNTVALVVRKNRYDTGYWISYFIHGRQIAYGNSRNYQLQRFPVRSTGIGHQLSETDSLIHFLEEQYLMPYGNWFFTSPDKSFMRFLQLCYDIDRRGRVIVHSKDECDR